MDAGSPGRFECRNDACNDGVFFDEGGTLVDPFTRRSRSSFGDCNVCQSSLSNGISYAPYEDGSNEDGYVICPSCGHENQH